MSRKLSYRGSGRAKEVAVVSRKLSYRGSGRAKEVAVGSKKLSYRGSCSRVEDRAVMAETIDV